KTECLDAASSNSNDVSAARPIASSLPSGEKFNVRTMPPGPATFVSIRPDCTSQNVISLGMLSSSHQPLPETNVSPSGASAKEASLRWAGQMATWLPLRRSHLRIVLSWLQEKSVWPLRENTTPVTHPVCPLNVATIL